MQQQQAIRGNHTSRAVTQRDAVLEWRIEVPERDERRGVWRVGQLGQKVISQGESSSQEDFIFCPNVGLRKAEDAPCLASNAGGQLD